MTRHYRLLSDLTVQPQSTATESNFVIILAALLCALICVIGLAAVARCAWLRRTFTADRRSSGHPSPPQKGLKKEAVESLPKLRYNVAGNLKLTAECAICLTEYGEGEEIRVLPQCGHGFHVECVDTWLVSHSSCPSCRNILMVARCRKCGEVTEEVKVKEEGDLNDTV